MQACFHREVLAARDLKGRGSGADVKSAWFIKRRIIDRFDEKLAVTI